MKLADTSDLKSDSFKEYRFKSDNEYQKFMWYLMVGNVLTILTYSVYLNYLYKLEEINTVEIFFGWFFLEHIFEQYNTTPGKLFLIYEDFRTLIINIVLLTRNIFFMAQLFTPAEFVFINIVLIYLIFKFKNKLKFNTVKIFLVLSYGLIFNSFLFVDICLILKTLNHVCIAYLISFTVLVYLCIAYQGIFFGLLRNQPANICIKFFITKGVVYIILLFLTVFLVFFMLNVYVILNENFTQEFVLSNLILYFYVYNF